MRLPQYLLAFVLMISALFSSMTSTPTEAGPLTCTNNNVKVSVTNSSTVTGIDVSITARKNGEQQQLIAIDLVSGLNAIVRMNGTDYVPPAVLGSFPPGTSTVNFSVRRGDTSLTQQAHVNLLIHDLCGEWKSFVADRQREPEICMIPEGCGTPSPRNMQQQQQQSVARQSTATATPKPKATATKTPIPATKTATATPTSTATATATTSPSVTTPSGDLFTPLSSWFTSVP